MKIEDAIYFGVITKPKGFKGELHFKAEFFNEDVLDQKFVYIMIGKHLTEYQLEKISVLGEKGTLKFKGIDTEKDALSLLKFKMYLPLADFENIEEEDVNALIGYKAFEGKKGLIGTIININDESPQILLIIKKEKREIYIPLVEDFVLSVDPEKKEIHFDLPEGLLELNE